MSTQGAAAAQTISDVVERFVREEKEAMESLRARIAGLNDSNMRSVFEQISELRARYVAELESRFGEIKSRAEITNQINEMFL